MIITSGTGTRYDAKVDSEHRLHTFSVTEPEDKHINREGKTWSVLSNTTAVGTGDYIFYFENTGTEAIAITDVRAIAGAATTLYIDKVSGTPTYTAGSDLTPVARNLGSSKTITATIKEDTNTTGLTNDGTIFFIRCDTANELVHLRTTSNIIIPQGQAIALRTSVATSVEVLWSFIGLSS